MSDDNRPIHKKRVVWRSKDRNATIEVYGSWNRFEKPTILQYEGRGVFACDIEVPEGEHYYRFLVDDDWETDGEVSKTVKLGNEYNTLSAFPKEEVTSSAPGGGDGPVELGGEAIAFDAATGSLKMGRPQQNKPDKKSKRRARGRPSMEIQLSTDFLASAQNAEYDDDGEEVETGTGLGASSPPRKDRKERSSRRKGKKKKKKRNKPRGRPFDFSGDVDLAEAFKQKEEEWARMCFVQQLRQQQAHNDEINRVKTLWKQERQVRVEMHKKVVTQKSALEEELTNVKADLDKVNKNHTLDSQADNKRAVQLQKEKDDLQSRYQSLTQDMNNMSNELAKAKSAASNDAIADQKRDLEIQNELTAIKAQLRERDGEVEALTLKKDAMEKNMTEMRESHKRALLLEADKVKAAQATGAEDVEELTMVKADLTKAQNEIADKAREVQKAQDAAGDLERELLQIKKVEERLRVQVKELQSDTSAQEDAAKSLSAQKVEFEKQMADMSAELEDQKKHSTHLEEQIAASKVEHEKTISDLRADHEVAISAMGAKAGADVASQVATMNAKLEDKDKQIAAKGEELVELKSKLEDATSSCEKVQKQLNASEEESEKLKASVEGATTELTALKKKMQETQEEFQAFQDKATNADSSAASKISSLEKELAAMTETNTATEQKLGAADGEIAELKAKIEEEKASGSDKDKAMAEMTEKADMLGQDINTHLASIAALNNKNSSLNDALNEANENSKVQGEKLGKQIEELITKNTTLEEENRNAIQTVQKELDGIREEFAEKSRAFDEVELNLEKAKSDFEIEKTKMEQKEASLQAKLAVAGQKDEKIMSCCKNMLKEFQAVRVSMETVRSCKTDELEKMNEFFPKFGELLNKTLNFNAKLVKDTLEKYKKELSLRRKYFNLVQELRGNIRVFCRVRPILPFEIKKGGDHSKSCLKFPVEEDFAIKVNQNGEIHSFEYDKVYKPAVPQEMVSEDTTEYVISVMDGYNVSIFAYGQTGSGKTYTMDGPPDNPGVNTRALAELFKLAEERAPMFEYTINCSMYEIYNDKVVCLLTDPKEAKKNKITYKVRQNPDGTVFVQNAKSMEVSNSDDVQKLLATGKSNRKTASTLMNSESSRSHMILEVSVRGFNVPANIEYLGKLFLVDLAGSERVAKSGAKGARLKEAAAINKSLTALGDVLQSLQKKKGHTPYRNSTLTYLMQNSLGGHAKTVMFVNVCPTLPHSSETMSSLRFAQRVAKVELGQATKTIKKIGAKISKMEKKGRR